MHMCIHGCFPTSRLKADLRLAYDHSIAYHRLPALGLHGRRGPLREAEPELR